MDSEIKITQYADDTTLFINDTENSLSEVLSVLDHFCKISGLKINYDKSSIFPLGPFKDSPPLFVNNHYLNLTNGPVTLLGIIIDRPKDNFFKINFLPKLSRLKNLLNLWSTRDLTIIGKITILKTLAISQFVYLFQVLPNPPTYFIKEVKKVMFNFIWNNKVERIKRSVLCNSYDSGGLNMIDLDSFVKGLKCAWVKRYLNDQPGDWKLFFDYHLHKFGKNFLFRCNISPSDFTGMDDIFIKHVCLAWASFSYKIPNNEFQNQLIWNNSCIRIGNAPVFFKL